mmetsp:Transcript_51405/g.159154  ORF Transcript_51405/g.159154 Transcript_51405/m.159154 type:complete len:341 (+) Transcript_51405:325-1347(+)
MHLVLSVGRVLRCSCSLSWGPRFSYSSLEHHGAGPRKNALARAALEVLHALHGAVVLALRQVELHPKPRAGRELCGPGEAHGAVELLQHHHACAQHHRRRHGLPNRGARPPRSRGGTWPSSADDRGPLAAVIGQPVPIRGLELHAAWTREEAPGRLAAEVLHVLHAAVVLAFWVVELHADPRARCELRGADETDDARELVQHHHAHAEGHLRRHRLQVRGARLLLAGARRGQQAAAGRPTAGRPGGCSVSAGLGRPLVIPLLLQPHCARPREEAMGRCAAEVLHALHLAVVLALGAVELHPDPVAWGELRGSHEADDAVELLQHHHAYANDHIVRQRFQH